MNYGMIFVKIWVIGWTGLNKIVLLVYNFQKKTIQLQVFVPLLFAMSSFLGVKSTEIKTKSTSSTSIVPYTTASNALRAFLVCKGCSTVAEGRKI